MDMDEINEKISSNILKKYVEEANENTSACPVRRLQETVEALKRENFNLKVERFLLQEELRKGTFNSNFSQDHEKIFETLEEYKVKYDRLEQDLEEKYAALMEAISVIEHHEKVKKKLEESHAAKIQNITEELKIHQRKVLALKTTLDKRDETIRKFRLKKRIRLNRKRYENEFKKIGNRCAGIFVLPGRAVTRISAYRRKLFRVNFIDVGSNINHFKTELKSQKNDKQNKVKTVHNDLTSNELLEMILKWIAMRHHAVDHEFDIIFSKDLYKDIESMRTIGTKPTKVTDESEKNIHYVKTFKSCNSSPACQKTSTELKLSPIHLLKLIFMPFGCPLRHQW